MWFVIGLGLFMAVSLWIFPEPKKDVPTPAPEDTGETP
jgi:hypothetical protein